MLLRKFCPGEIFSSFPPVEERGKGREGESVPCAHLSTTARSVPPLPLRCQPREVPFLPLFQNGISFYLRRPTGGASGLCQTSTTALFSSFRSPFTSVARKRRAKRGKIIKICHSASPPRVRCAGGGRTIAFLEFLFPLPSFSISFLLSFLFSPFPYPSLFLHLL